MGVAVIVAAGSIASFGAGSAFPRRALAELPDPTRSSTTTVLIPVPVERSIDYDSVVAGNRAVFDAERDSIDASLRTQDDPRLTALKFDPKSNEVRAAFAYADPANVSASRRDAFAWHVGETLSQTFWFPELVASVREHGLDPAWLPRLRITVDRSAYVCPASAQIALAAKGMSLEDWVGRCSI